MAKRTRTTLIPGDTSDAQDMSDGLFGKFAKHAKGAAVSIRAHGASAPVLTTIFKDLERRVPDNPNIDRDKPPLSVLFDRKAVHEGTNGAEDQPFLGFAFPGKDNQAHWYAYRLDGLPEGGENGVFGEMAGQLAQVGRRDVLDRYAIVPKRNGAPLDADIDPSDSFGSVIQSLASGVASVASTAASIAPMFLL